MTDVATTRGKELWLFTMRFPYGLGETFIGTELPFLCERFDRVVIFPLIAEGEPRIIPANASIRNIIQDAFKPASAATLLRHAWLFITLVRSVRVSAPSRAVLRKHWPAVFSQCRHALERYDITQKTLAAEYIPTNVVLYSFWTADWSTVLGLWKEADKRVRFVGRMQGFDLYAERHADAWPPFRIFQLDRLQRLFVTSRTGINYLNNRYPKHPHVFEYSPLGTDDHGLAPWSPSPVLRIVSVANIIPIKRVHLLAEALRLVNIPVEWTHFGDGPERADLERRIVDLPANVHVYLKGRTPHAEVLTWYTRNPIDLFVHTSCTEGLPLSMKEAASFGVPMLAADAGGVKEIVNEHTGILMPTDPSPELIAQHLHAHQHSARDAMAFRTGARAWWAERFEAQQAYGRFLDRFLAVHNAG